MREPYETLLGQYRNHELLGRFLDGYEPDFAALAASEVPMMISAGELLMLHVALAFYNGDRTAKVADLARLDEENLTRITDALHIAMGMFR